MEYSGFLAMINDPTIISHNKFYETFSHRKNKNSISYNFLNWMCKKNENNEISISELQQKKMNETLNCHKSKNVSQNQTINVFCIILTHLRHSIKK